MTNPTGPSYDDLRRPLPLASPKGLYYAAARLGLGSLGRLSDGVRLGYRYGFDSGVMLEYVYRNRPSGVTPLGRLVDQVFLNSPGWRGIRARGELVKTALREVLGAELERGRTPHLLDVACGGGRYDLEVLGELGPGRVKATLRDYREENVESARALAAELGVPATLERGDAFSDADLARVSPPPDVVVVSGLHEILPDDALIENHFRQVANILAPGGTLIFTVQPHHPQLEFIARVLPSHAGGPWVMRLRSLEQTRAWAEAAGFTRLETTMEPQGIFGVVKARRA